jgi:hypothetical protein
MLRVQTNETLGGRLCSFRLGVFIVGVDQLQLCLIGVATERITRLQSLQLGCGAGVAVVVQVSLSLLIQLGFAEAACVPMTAAVLGGAVLL